MGLGARPEARVGPHIDREGVQPLYNILGLVWGSRVRTGGGKALLTAFRFHKSRSRVSARLWLCQEPRELAGWLSTRCIAVRGIIWCNVCTAETSNACGLARTTVHTVQLSPFFISSFLTTPCLLRSYDALCLCCAHPLVLTNLDALSLLPTFLSSSLPNHLAYLPYVPYHTSSSSRTTSNSALPLYRQAGK